LSGADEGAGGVAYDAGWRSFADSAGGGVGGEEAAMVPAGGSGLAGGAGGGVSTAATAAGGGAGLALSATRQGRSESGKLGSAGTAVAQGGRGNAAGWAFGGDASDVPVEASPPGRGSTVALGVVAAGLSFSLSQAAAGAEEHRCHTISGTSSNSPIPQTTRPLFTFDFRIGAPP
jgi:hypothetical protein